ncbi:hypothetical protein SDJN03_13529, partial [Cucurbita argyrosperma subsp. sororia]
MPFNIASAASSSPAIRSFSIFCGRWTPSPDALPTVLTRNSFGIGLGCFIVTHFDITQNFLLLSAIAFQLCLRDIGIPEIKPVVFCSGRAIDKTETLLE